MSNGVDIGLFDEPGLLVPLAGRAVQNWQSFWLGLVQTLTQQIGEKMVVALPTPFFIQGNDEQISAFQRFQDFLAVILVSERITQGTSESVEDGSLE